MAKTGTCFLDYVTFVKETDLLLLWSLATDVDYQVSEMAPFSIYLFRRYFLWDSSESGTIGPKFIKRNNEESPHSRRIA